MSKSVRAAIIIPTRRRAEYLDRALATLVDQAREHGAELIVVDDSGSPGDAATRAAAERHGARLIARTGPPGLNSARNAAIAATRAELLCFVDDDIEAGPGWLAALLSAAAEQPLEAGVFTGPIRARFDDHRFRTCGREGSPITELDLGSADRDTERAWGANLAIRRGTIERIGPFDPHLPIYGDEEEWEQRWLDAGGRIRYVAAAALEHVRSGDDARLRALTRAAYRRGRSARAYDRTRGVHRSMTDELRTLAGSAWHGPRRLCFNGPPLVAHSIGRIAEALRPTPVPARAGVDDFLSGFSGALGARRDVLLRVADRLLDVRTLLLLVRRRRRARAEPPRQRILVVGVCDPTVPNTTESITRELRRSRHDVVIDIRTPGDAGKFENVNVILADHDLGSFDYLVVTDDDIELPRGFLDLVIQCAYEGDLTLAQPAHRRHSNAAWPVTRRTAAAWRETNFVEIGPLTIFAKRAFGTLVPFDDTLRMGWGLDLHWSAVARERGWRLGIVDIAAVDHSLRGIASTYKRDEALAEARAYLADRPYTSRDEVRTLASHR